MTSGKPGTGQVFAAAAVVLAAGRSARFEGGHKLLAPVDKLPLIARVLSEVAASSVSDIVLVVAEDGARVAAAAGPGRWRTIVNAEAEMGLATSLRAGIGALDKPTDGALIVLADMPGVTLKLIERVLSAAAAAPSMIIYPLSADGRQGHPVFWPADLFTELQSLAGDKGAKSLLDRHKARCAPIDSASDDAFSDIDTRAALVAFVSRKA